MNCHRHFDHTGNNWRFPEVLVADVPEALQNTNEILDKVEIYIPEDDETQVIQVVTTVRTDPRKGLISKESPFGKTVLGKKVGDVITVHVSEAYSYEAEIRSITKGEDDGSVPLLGY